MTVFVHESIPTRSVRRLPATKDTDGITYHIHPETEDELLNRLGWWRVDETPKPDDTDNLTHRSRIVPADPGPGFVMEWFHDPDAHTGRLDREDRLNDRHQLKADIEVLRGIAQDADQPREIRQLARIVRRVIRAQAMDD